ncbi:MAG: hypothetical protein IPH13_03720 [Planctomycetes bacterium]|nr:hypothetical protein [Planctomycetota bacterium]MCC7172717.1 hypothetical protein [Planctomycetota bacterium]
MELVTERKAFLLRIDPDLAEELRRWAAADLRSLNAQIEFLLRKALAEHRHKPAQDPPPPSESP